MLNLLRRASAVVRGLPIAASLTLLLPAGATLCVDDGRHLVLEWPQAGESCCDAPDGRAGDACGPEACRTCEDIVVSWGAALRADSDGCAEACLPAAFAPNDGLPSPALLGRLPSHPRWLGLGPPTPERRSVLRI